MVNQGIGQFQPTYDAGVAATQATTTPFNASSLDAYMNPYTSQVTDEIARLGNENFTDNLMPQVNSQFTGGGMFGSSRNATALGREATKAHMGITGQQSQALQQGFQNSMNAYQTDQSRNLQAGQNLVNQAGAGQQMYGADVNALNASGQQQQQNTQQGLDIGYNEFLAQQAYPQVQAQYFNNIVRGIPQTGLTQTQTQEYGGNGNSIGNALGLGGVLYSATNSSPQVTAKLNKGGHIKAKKAKKATSKAPSNVGIGGMAYV